MNNRSRTFHSLRAAKWQASGDEDNGKGDVQGVRQNYKL